jgi:hypothetical protein
MRHRLTSVVASTVLALLGLLALPALSACSGEAPDDDGATPPVQPRDGGAPAVETGPAGADTGAPDVSVGECAPLKYPSGVTLRTKPDAKMTAAYAPLAEEPYYPLPECFIDTQDLLDPITGTTYDLDVKVGKYFTLRELVATSLKYTQFALLSPLLVEKLDRYREALGGAVAISSGYRSPQHQRAVCQDMCGAESCGGLCAKRSRHSWGDAVDHGVPPDKKHSDAGCAAEFNYVFREGDHVHLDLNPQHEICTVDIL